MYLANSLYRLLLRGLIFVCHLTFNSAIITGATPRDLVIATPTFSSLHYKFCCSVFSTV